ncbi:CDP-alcohol phosphatidyltransferase family protein [Amaricoccus sp.]|uniref:CDP-alcohol phosphatidyltransferase family protein n=1 Tax=Amaricoccus sp. TaxID=1872485 RepID=UPI001B54B77B|nr:CDP-alcohol phosphatidyltransferase family protein [Amaricoccus sp.]MBP7002811.1 CDP-alcohol phosphatidyltransferase family protein [Amaricoccus sp.]
MILAPATRASALPGVAALGVATAVVAGRLLPPAGVAVALAVYAVAGTIVVAAVGRHALARFGLGNTVTLVRLAGAAVLAGFVTAPGALAWPTGWLAAAAAGALLALDGVDGWAARRQGLDTAFGARFDMETDALTILVLSTLALALGKAGPWILALGAMRYAFVLAGLALPRLAAPLPPSARRKAVCVLQIAVLSLLLAPPLAPPASAALAALALAALAWSFAVDVRFLLRRAR